MYNNELFSLRAPICSICNAPVLLDSAKTDEDGAAIHEACYLVKIGVRKPVSISIKVSDPHRLETPRQKRDWGD
jgi:hypothetical protein